MACFTASSAPLPSPDGVAKGVACAQCGALLDCAMERGSTDCWCRQLPPVLPVPSAALAGKVSCYCPQCLAAQALAARRPQAANPKNNGQIAFKPAWILRKQLLKT